MLEVSVFEISSTCKMISLATVKTELAKFSTTFRAMLSSTLAAR